MPRVGAALRRQDVVEAAVRVIAAHGAAGATTRRIAAEAGCPLASLHYVFHTKDDLFQAVFDALLTAQLAPVPAEVQSAPLDQVCSWLLRAEMDWLIAHPELARATAELFNWALYNNRSLAIGPYRNVLERSHDLLTRTVVPLPDTRVMQRVERLLLIQIDGLLTSWFAQNDLNQLREDIDTVCEAVSAYVRYQLAETLVQ